MYINIYEVGLKSNGTGIKEFISIPNDKVYGFSSKVVPLVSNILFLLLSAMLLCIARKIPLGCLSVPLDCLHA